jgi:hypothetical protein
VKSERSRKIRPKGTQQKVSVGKDTRGHQRIWEVFR